MSIDQNTIDILSNAGIRLYLLKYLIDFLMGLGGLVIVFIFLRFF